MSYISYRLATIAAAVIFFLVILLVILWTGFFSGDTTGIVGVYGKDHSAGVVHQKQSSETDSRQEDERLESLMSDRSVADTLELNSSDISNEVLRRPIKDALENQENRDEDFLSGDSKGKILPTAKGNLEYINLIKLSWNHHQDPPNEYSTVNTQHSGHFRHRTAKVWDPHPQYEFTAFGKHFHLLLSHDSSFVYSDMKIAHIKENTSKWEHAGQHLDCFFTGKVKGDPKSIVAVNLCGGMTGQMTTSTGSYLIKPTKHWSDDENISNNSTLPHAIYRTSSTDSSLMENLPRNHGCGVIDYAEDEPILAFDDSSEKNTDVRNQHRRRKRRLLWKNPSSEDFENEDDLIRNRSRYDLMGRERTYRSENDRHWSHQSVEADFDNYAGWRSRRALPREYFIEIMIAADSSMSQFHGNDIINYILILMHTVHRIFKDASVGNAISIAVVKIFNTDKVFIERRSDDEGVSASKMLKEFCDWQKSNNPDEPSVEHHDVAILLTRETLCHNVEMKSCNTLGLAELGKMCSPGQSCAIVQDNGLAAAFTIAHEIGHVFNMPHDDDKRCSKFSDPNLDSHNGSYFAMSRAMDVNTFPWGWSKCSRHYITEFLDTGAGQCLLDKPGETLFKWKIEQPPGDTYTPEKQCELGFGTGAKLCYPEHDVVISLTVFVTGQAVCKRLWCSQPLSHPHCRTQNNPWADGTECGINKWCLRGECVPRQTLIPIDGQWSDWGSYGECTRTCGGGVKKKSRECNNPMPQNGGNYCAGERYEYENCGSEECPGNVDFREEQCAAYNNNNFSIVNEPADVKWVPSYFKDGDLDHRCKLYCSGTRNLPYKMREKVVDGTPCGPDTFDMCINGRCEPAGCDHILYSSARMDTCGVCMGDNSTCHRITGSFNESTDYGYTTITKIPAGSSFIDIRQYSSREGTYDQNYLVLRYAKNKESIVNGNQSVMQEKLISVPGVTMHYNGFHQVVERLNSSRPIQEDLILEILSVDNEPPQITYEYTVPNKILKRYTWVLSDWSECSSSCQGMSYRRAECKDTEHKDVVSNGYCRDQEKPQEKSKSCNTHCLVQWIITSESECSNHCGPGTRRVTSRCYQVLESEGLRQTRPVSDYICHHLERPKEKQHCTGPCHDVRWNYGDWGACSVTCGGGIQRRSASCIDSTGGSIPDENCASQEKILTQICGQEACPRWAFGDWTPCSVTCGIGKRKRPYWCTQENHVVHENYCSGSLPVSSEICDAGPCYQWHSSKWSSCSVTCGDGTRKREVTCRDNNDLVSKETHCDSSKKPLEASACMPSICPTMQTLPSVNSTTQSQLGDPSQQDNEVNHIFSPPKTTKWPTGIDDEASRQDQCNIQPCPRWITGAWSKCDVSCGEGYRYRLVRCRSLRGTILPDMECSLKHRPRHVMKCKLSACKSLRDNSLHRWRSTSWSACSAGCGEGVQRRNVTCHLVDAYGWLDPTPITGCPTNEKPVEEQVCKVRECKYYWTAGNWKKCSHSCGKKGRQVRRLFCHDNLGNKVPRQNCPAKSKPQRKRKCNRRRCGPSTCLEIQKKYRNMKDKEYTLIIGGRNMSIYCHGMSSREPKEYLTLPAGDKENFAEIYNKRLLNPNTCPSGGRRDDNCHCVTDQGTIAGLTSFVRVRIDVTKLTIIADDYTFSRTNGSKRVEFGKAGDCYSLANCPQGRFSINLSGTYFKLSPHVSWTTRDSKAFHVINRINDQKILGKCGGYCGFCTPKSGLKLDILPP